MIPSMHQFTNLVSSRIFPILTVLNPRTHRTQLRLRDQIQRSMSNCGLIDIAANLTDEMYQGIYHGKEYHPPDVDRVVHRAKDAGVQKIIITGGSLEMSREALRLAETNDALYSTVGVHPTRCNELVENPEHHVHQLIELAREGKDKGKVVAIGECGLDYDRLQFCDKETQKRHFADQFLVAEETQLPMFLHMRAAAEDFIDILNKNLGHFHGGVVHSFTGTMEEMQLLCNFENLYFGINGCSLKTQENLAVVEAMPTELMMIETDCPYCEIRSSHASREFVSEENVLRSIDKKKFDGASLIKNRNEPCNLHQVLDAIASVKQIDRNALQKELYRNTVKLFGL